MVCREMAETKKNESLSYDLPHSLFVANFIGSVDILSSLYVCVVKKNVCLVFVETPGTYKFCLTKITFCKPKFRSTYYN